MVITGAGGQVGRYLAGSAARAGYQVCALSHRDFDITDPEAARRRVGGGDLVVNCAAFTNVDAAESDPATAHAVNAVGPDNLARACAAAGARLIHLSTDYVFSGVFSGDLHRPYDISDPTGPLNVYGRSKLDGELAVHAALPDAQVVRTSWVYTGGSGTDFVAIMRRLAATDRTVDMVADQIGSPTYTGDLVDALLQIATGAVTAPLLHAANAGSASRFDQARAVFTLLGADPDRVRPVSTAAAARPARRPVFSALSMAGSARAGLTPLRPWRDALRAALAVPVADGPIASSP
ncbi:MAG: dTDP-4-dehydrorhamnose reductase [Mycobacterium sp.]|nr:dTDP-4-dehydrorhamnose reductase [Mycobacterium sp.]